MVRFMVAVVAAFAAVAIAGAAYVFSGTYNVAASRRHAAFTAWLLDETMEQSVRKHATTIQVPPLQDREQVRTGYEHYTAMCETCHGAPGVEPSELARGLEPTPPLLYEDEEARAWSAAEMFWITKHGIKMTGMPAWGATHSDEAIWAIVAFLETLPQMNAEEYAALGSARGQPPAHHHEHDEGHDHADAHEHGDAEGHGGAHQHTAADEHGGH